MTGAESDNLFLDRGFDQYPLFLDGHDVTPQISMGLNSFEFYISIDSLTLFPLPFVQGSSSRRFKGPIAREHRRVQRDAADADPEFNSNTTDQTWATIKPHLTLAFGYSCVTLMHHSKR